MKADKNRSVEAVELRRRAELLMRAQAPDADAPLSADEARRLLHELQIHQIELEMQNAELRQARDQAEQALGKYADLYDFAPVGYVTLDHDGMISAVNLAGATLLGIERSRLVGRSLSLSVAIETRPAFTFFLDKVFSSTAKESCELSLLREGNGSLFVQIEAVAAASGGECRVALIDISVRRQLEEKLEIVLTDLAARAAELETANIELEAFNYSVSHDLRGPLTIIAGYCDVVELLYGKKLEEKCREYLREIHEGTMRMNRLIDTLLNFSFVKRIAMCREQVDLSRMAEEVALSLKVTEPERRVTFRIAAGIMAEGDASLLRMVLDNLIGNAWKHSDRQEETVIAFGVTADDGKSAYFVRDNGPGFDMAVADKLFLPFQRLPGTDAEGHGIGLATVNRIVSRHGGRVWAESKPGAGATFYFTLA
jgi:PAS domain S-box-containing protein